MISAHLLCGKGKWHEDGISEMIILQYNCKRCPEIFVGQEYIIIWQFLFYGDNVVNDTVMLMWLLNLDLMLVMIDLMFVWLSLRFVMITSIWWCRSRRKSWSHYPWDWVLGRYYTYCARHMVRLEWSFLGRIVTFESWHLVLYGSSNDERWLDL